MGHVPPLHTLAWSPAFWHRDRLPTCASVALPTSEEVSAECSGNIAVEVGEFLWLLIGKTGWAKAGSF